MAFSCDARGVITWADSRAARMLGAEPGRPLMAMAVPGAEQKIAALLERAQKEQLKNWEIPIMAFSRPGTLCVCTKPEGDGKIEVHGLLLPDGYGTAVQQLNDSMQEVVNLNREIVRQKRELQQQKDALLKANRELDESNRGVVTLHAELEERADTIRRTSEVKTRVIANVSHEFRTPLHTILGLSKLLLDASDGPLTEEQEKQVRFIRAAAEELSELVDDLLDLSKVEAGKIGLRAEKFTISDLFAAMRGMLRPLVPANSEVDLIFEEPTSEIALETDKGKVAQVVRNLVSNALKFTERGEVRVTAVETHGHVLFQVRDTGIGIRPEHFERVFEEFGQIEGPLQARVKGTGLGLPLSKRLAEILGGSLTLESEYGKGSMFTLAIPSVHPEVQELAVISSRPLDPARASILVVEDDRKTIFIYEKYLAMAGYQVVPARTIEDARTLLERLRPAAIVLDIMLEGETSWEFLAQIKKDERLSAIPVLVVTVTNKERKARAFGADEFWLKPVNPDLLLRKLKAIGKPGAPARVLVIDDDERARYLMRKILDKTPYTLEEASTGPEGIHLAQESRPDVIVLDFLLRDMTAFDVLDALKADPRTRSIPVIIATSHVLDPHDRERLAAETETILSKENLSRELALNRIRDALRKAGVGGNVIAKGRE